MPVKYTLALATLAGIAFLAGSAPGAPALDRPVSPNADSAFTLVRGGGGGHGGGGHGGFGGGHGGFGGHGFGGAFAGRGLAAGSLGGRGQALGIIQDRSMAMSGLGGRPFAPPPGPSSFAAIGPRAGNWAARGIRQGRLDHGRFAHGHFKRRRFFVSGFGWVDSDYCSWPYNWGPWCYND